MTKQILIVEDEIEIKEILCIYLEKNFDLEILCAISTDEATVMLDNNPEIILIICDYIMPEKTGGEFYDHFKSKNKDIPFIFSSWGPWFYAHRTVITAYIGLKFVTL